MSTLVFLYIPLNIKTIIYTLLHKNGFHLVDKLRTLQFSLYNLSTYLVRARQFDMQQRFEMSDNTRKRRRCSALVEKCSKFFQ